MVLNLDLSEEDVQLLTSIIDNWVEGVRDSKDMTIEDPTIDTPEDLLDLMSGYDEDLGRLNRIRKMLHPKAPVPLTQEEKIESRKRWDARYEASLGRRQLHDLDSVAEEFGVDLNQEDQDA